MKKTLLLGALIGVLSTAAISSGATVASGGNSGNIRTVKNQGGKIVKENLNLTREWDKVFPKSDKVEHRKVTFTNRYGITLAADLYIPKGKTGKLPAIAISGPFGAVKEQSSGLYAQTLAERGFIALAFDGSYTGESGGSVRNVASPDINTEDYGAALDFLVNYDKVDANRVGILGICGWGGMALNAASMDTRIKATVVSTMYDMTRVMANGYNDTVNEEQRYTMKEQLNEQRTKDYSAGQAALNIAGSLPEKLTGNEPQFVKDYFGYYKTKRGFHSRSVNSNGAWTVTTPLSFINMPILQRAGEIKNPVLVVHGEKSHSRYFSEDAFKKLKGNNKELLIIPDANHVDLYDNLEKIPFDKIVSFFNEKL